MSVNRRKMQQMVLAGQMERETEHGRQCECISLEICRNLAPERPQPCIMSRPTVLQTATPNYGGISQHYPHVAALGLQFRCLHQSGLWRMSVLATETARATAV